MQFEFIADRPVLDFVATVAERGSTDVEHLTSPADLSRWITQSGLVDDAPTVGEAELRRARTLRDAAFRLIQALIDGGDTDPVDRALTNGAAARPLPHLQLTANGVHRTGDVDAVLALLARDCVDLHDSPDRFALRWCADDRCTRPFVDRSRGGRRRWCGMRGCGDRAKAAAYRRRQQAR